MVKLATTSLQNQLVIIRFLYFSDEKPIDIHPQLSEICSDSVMDVNIVRACVGQLKEGRISCDNRARLPYHERPGLIALGVTDIASITASSMRSVQTILHENLKIREVPLKWLPRMLTQKREASRVSVRQVMLTRDDEMNAAFFSCIVTMGAGSHWSHNESY